MQALPSGTEILSSRGPATKRGERSAAKLLLPDSSKKGIQIHRRGKKVDSNTPQVVKSKSIVNNDYLTTRDDGGDSHVCQSEECEHSLPKECQHK